MARASALSRVLKFPDDPITLAGHYRLTAIGLDIHGRPEFDDHIQAGEFIRRVYLRGGWWLADWLRYGESRKDWAHLIEQAQELTGLSRKTLQNLRVLGTIATAQRRSDLDFSLYYPLTSLPPAVQDEILDKAQQEEWGRREVTEEVRVRKRAATIEGQAVLEGQYRKWIVDCPWRYGQAQPSGSSSSRHYPPMSIDELCALPVQAHATKDAVMGFWVPAPLLYDSPGPRDVIDAWGFKYKNLLVWDKVKGAGGFYTEGSVELFLICTRGSCTPDLPRELPRSVYVERKTEHSTKPAWFRQYIDKHWTTGRSVELFGREPVKGWAVLGNDAKLWGKGLVFGT